VIPDIYSQLEIPEHDRVTSIKKEEAEFLYEFIQSHTLTKTIEVGFAYGCSTAYIMQATGRPHVAIDPYFEAYGNGLGPKNIEKLGLQSRLIHIQEISHAALPRLLREKQSFDFAFIDGGHKFDEIFIDWYYLDLLLDKQGYIAFHDTWMRSTQMVNAFIRANRKDYREEPSPVENISMFQKIGADERKWDHFVEFC
jgi:predicted O-methyltransferase YrrM